MKVSHDHVLQGLRLAVTRPGDQVPVLHAGPFVDGERQLGVEQVLKRRVAEIGGDRFHRRAGMIRRKHEMRGIVVARLHAGDGAQVGVDLPAEISKEPRLLQFLAVEGEERLLDQMTDVPACIHEWKRELAGGGSGIIQRKRW